MLLKTGPLLNVTELNRTVLNPVLGFSVVCYNGKIQNWKVEVVYKQFFSELSKSF